ncbi:fungal-specific transcription factor domain-containing protein [Multifurca ochricompacta]|uniref:Fungal-specific transcription factor domain-containing protein n=1 Tax=Multifurca ochricompacta TaxID=376703 RepID=A0AAD4QP41_9AGAM|nr:fungal-specific transcription factor domain-containing protein [Multifurca ochricompacta]
MGRSDSITIESMTHQTKKKRVEDQSLPSDAGQRPVQLQRRRVWRACESCRRKKIKCDGNEPTCSQCATSGSQCTWLQTKDRAALSRHYVQELEARLLHMESVFAQLTQQLGQTPNGEGALPSSSPSDESKVAAAALLRSIISKGSQNVQSHPTDNPSTPDSSSSVKIEDDVSDSFGQLTLDEHGHMRWIGGSSTMSLIQSFRAATTAPHARASPMADDSGQPNKLYFPAAVFFGKVRALPGPEEVEYPERDLADKLVGAYFSRFHFLLPVIDKPTFMRQYTYLMDHQGEQHLARTQTAFIAMVFALFACAAQLVDDPRLKGEKDDDGGMGMVYYERALILHYISHASIQISHVQCFVLMSSFLCSVNCLPQAWLLIGQAVRAAQDLGLHRSPRRLMVSAIEKETRRKIWWGVYTLDRMLALALGRPIGAEDVDCDVELPIDIDDDFLPEYFAGAPMTSETPSLMTGFTSLVSLYNIAGRVMRQVYGVDMADNTADPEKRAQLQVNVDTLDKELTKWLDNLPPVFKSLMINEKQVSMGAALCSHYYSVLTALHRNLLPVRRDQPPAPRSNTKAVSSARTCIRLAPFIKNVVPPSHHLAFFIQHLFSSAVIILLYAMHVADPGAANSAMEEAQSCLAALEPWEGHWPGARKVKELLVELMTTAREAVIGNQTANATASGSAASIAASTSVMFATPSVPFDKGRRHSFTASSRVAKSKSNLRRNLSPDAGRPSRSTQASTALRFESQRARSASRKRGHDETEEPPSQSGSSNAYRLQYQLGFGRPNLSPHSSPTSAKSYPSPPLPHAEASLERSPPIVNAPSFGSWNGPVSPVGGMPSPSRYDFDFSASSPHGFERWGYDGDQFPRTSQSMTATGTYEQPSTVDPSYLAYAAPSSSQVSSDFFGTPIATTTGPSFLAAGLPFHGLDYLRNFDPDGGEQDALGQGFDVGAFRYDPELPFTLPELPTEPTGQ